MRKAFDQSQQRGRADQSHQSDVIGKHSGGGPYSDKIQNRMFWKMLKCFSGFSSNPIAKCDYSPLRLGVHDAWSSGLSCVRERHKRPGADPRTMGGQIGRLIFDLTDWSGRQSRLNAAFYRHGLIYAGWTPRGAGTPGAADMGFPTSPALLCTTHQ